MAYFGVSPKFSGARKISAGQICLTMATLFYLLLEGSSASLSSVFITLSPTSPLCVAWTGCAVCCLARFESAELKGNPDQAAHLLHSAGYLVQKWQQLRARLEQKPVYDVSACERKEKKAIFSGLLTLRSIDLVLLPIDWLSPSSSQTVDGVSSLSLSLAGCESALMTGLGASSSSSGGELVISATAVNVFSLLLPATGEMSVRGRRALPARGESEADWCVATSALNTGEDGSAGNALSGLPELVVVAEGVFDSQVAGECV
jgi:hypothetical protein